MLQVPFFLRKINVERISKNRFVFFIIFPLILRKRAVGEKKRKKYNF